MTDEDPLRNLVRCRGTVAAFMTTGSLASQWLSWFHDSANTMYTSVGFTVAPEHLWSTASCSTPSSPPLVYHHAADNRDYLISGSVAYDARTGQFLRSFAFADKNGAISGNGYYCSADLAGQCFIYDLQDKTKDTMPTKVAVGSTPDYRLDRYHLVNASQDAFYIVGEKKLKTYGLSGIAKVNTAGQLQWQLLEGDRRLPVTGDCTLGCAITRVAGADHGSSASRPMRATAAAAGSSLSMRMEPCSGASRITTGYRRP